MKTAQNLKNRMYFFQNMPNFFLGITSGKISQLSFAIQQTETIKLTLILIKNHKSGIIIKYHPFIFRNAICVFCWKVNFEYWSSAFLDEHLWKLFKISEILFCYESAGWTSLLSSGFILVTNWSTCIIYSSFGFSVENIHISSFFQVFFCSFLLQKKFITKIYHNHSSNFVCCSIFFELKCKTSSQLKFDTKKFSNSVHKNITRFQLS